MMIDLVCNILQTVIDGLQSSKHDGGTGGRQLVIHVETLSIENFHASNPEQAATDAVEQLGRRLPWTRKPV